MFYHIYPANLLAEVRHRRQCQGQIRQLVERFVHDRFGILGYYSLVEQYIIAHLGGQGPYGVLARQIPSVSTEDVAMFLFCRKVGLAPLALSFTRDSFSSGSPDKTSRVKIPWLTWSKKGRPVIQCETILPTRVNELTTLHMQRLDTIITREGTLPQYHERLRTQVFNGSYPQRDVSSLHGEWLAQAKARGQPPMSIYRDEGGKDIVCQNYDEDDARLLRVRSSSKWYYPLYLSLFMDGTFVLLETYEDGERDVSKARQLFEETMRLMIRQIGWSPLILKTDPFTPDTVFYNRHIVDNPSLIEQLAQRAHPWHNESFRMTRFFADKVIEAR